MELSIPTETLHIIGIVYSAIAVALQVVSCFFFNTHSRALDYIQWGYFLAYATQNLNSVPFSTELEVGSSLIELPSESTTGFFCPLGTYVCSRSFALSFLVFLVGFLVVMRLITIPQKVREKGLTFQRVYRLFKGLFRWFYLPLVFQSLAFLFYNTEGQTVPSALILGVFLAFPIVQIVLYKFFDQEGEDPFTKWLQFASYCKAGLFALLLVLVARYSSFVYFYYISYILVAFAVFYVWKFDFKFEIASRVVYLSGEVIFFFLYSLYAGLSPWLSLYYLDLFGLGLILLLDIVSSIFEGTVVYKNWKSKRAGILPEESRDDAPQRNTYDVDQEIKQHNKNDSGDNLNDSRVSSNLIMSSSNIKKSPGRPRPAR